MKWRRGLAGHGRPASTTVENKARRASHGGQAKRQTTVCARSGVRTPINTACSLYGAWHNWTLTEGVNITMMTNNSLGWCRKCGEGACGVEPDARGVECESCGAREVCGAAEMIAEAESILAVD